MEAKHYRIGELEEKIKEEVGKTCIKHNKTIKQGRYGNWCGGKDSLGRWCPGYTEDENS